MKMKAIIHSYVEMLVNCRMMEGIKIYPAKSWLETAGTTTGRSRLSYN
jgi:hypothetical protein